MIWEIDDKQREIEGLDEAGNPDPEYAAALGLVPAPYLRRSLAFTVELALWLILNIPYAIFVLPRLLDVFMGRLDVYGFVQHPQFILSLVIWIVSFVLAMAFIIVQITLHGRMGVSIGKAMFGLRSVNVKTLEKPGFGRVLLRALVMWSSFLVPVIGPALFFASSFFDTHGRGRSWLDYVGATWCIDIKRGLNPYDSKRMRIARKTVKAEFHEEEEQLPSLATERAPDAAAAAPVYVPSTRTSSGVLGVAMPEGGNRRDSAPAPASAPATASAPTPQPAPPQPYRPGQLSGVAPAQPVPAQQQPQQPIVSAPPPSGHTAPPAAPPAAPPSAPVGRPAQPPARPAAVPQMPQPQASAPQPPVPTAQPSVPAAQPTDAIDDRTRIRPSGLDDDVAATRIAGRDSTPAAIIILDSGDRFELTGSALLGRNPRPDAGESVAHALPIDDPDQSISKTHLLLAFDGTRLLAVDRYSTNGSALERGGTLTPLSPGEPVELQQGDIVKFGDRTLQIQLP